MPKVKLTESALRRAIQAALLREADEAPADAPPAAGVWDALPFNELIGSNSTAKSLNDLIERFEGVAVREAESTSLVYRAWSQQAAKALGLQDPITSWLSTNPTESQKEALIAYLKLSVIFLLQHEDFTGDDKAGGWSVKGSEVKLVAPFFIDGENFYAPQMTVDQVAVALLNKIRDATAPGADITTYNSQAFYDKLSDTAFVQKIVVAKVQVSKLEPGTAIINSLSATNTQIIADKIVESNRNNSRELRETWDKINTGTYQNNFIIPVNVPNIWQAVHNDPRAPLYTPWRESWVVCNLFNKALALPGGAFALAAMLQKASDNGLSSQGATYRPLEGAATALSGEPLKESMRIMATREDLRRIINAALSESLKSKNRQINEGPWWDATKANARKVRDIFKSPSTEEAVEALAGSGKFLTGQSALDDAFDVFRSANKAILTPEAIETTGKIIKARLDLNLQKLKTAITAAEGVDINNPGTIDDILARPCVVDLKSGVRARSNPKLAETARQILNLATDYSYSSKFGTQEATAVIADKIVALIQALGDSSQVRALDTIFSAAKIKPGFFEEPIRNINFEADDFINGTPSSVEIDSLVNSFADETKRLVTTSIAQAKSFANNPIGARELAQTGAEAATGKSILSALGGIKYDPSSLPLLGKVILAGDKFVVSGLSKIALVKAGSKAPGLAKGLNWLIQNNLIRSIIVKQMLAFITLAAIEWTGTTGSEYENNPFYFALERLSDTNLLSASGAEIIVVGVAAALNLSSVDDELNDAYLTALTADPQIIEDILKAALDFHSNGIQIPAGSFPGLSTQTASKISADALMRALQKSTDALNFTGALRNRRIANATQEIEQVVAALPTATGAAGNSNDLEGVLTAKRKATVEASKGIIQASLLKNYKYRPPPNAKDLTADYPKTRLEDTFSMISLVSGLRGVDEIAALSKLIQIGAAPPLRRTSDGVKNLGDLGDTASTSSEPASATPISAEEAALNAAIKRLYDKLNPPTAAPPDIAADTASSTSPP